MKRIYSLPAIGLLISFLLARLIFAGCDFIAGTDAPPDNGANRKMIECYEDFDVPMFTSAGAFL